MGNHCVEGIPPLLVKNWQPVPDRPNSFRNRVTHEFAHKHIVTVEDSVEVESFKHRMQETNQYVCRVLYYHHYHQTIYQVYTDQMHAQPVVKHSEKWVQHRMKIVEAFRALTKAYGFMRVCKNMIGADSNGNIKIWINPDPVCAHPWSPCEKQDSMISDITTILQSLEDGGQQTNLNRTVGGLKKSFYTFQQLLEEENRNLERCRKNSRMNQSSHVENSTTNFNININIELDGKAKHQKQKHNESAVVKPTQFKLQKTANKTVCETTRNEPAAGTIMVKSGFDRMHRPSTDIPSNSSVNRAFADYRTQNNTKRRDSDFLAPYQTQPVKDYTKVKYDSKNMPNDSPNKRLDDKVGKNTSKAILGKLFSNNSKIFPMTVAHKTHKTHYNQNQSFENPAALASQFTRNKQPQTGPRSKNTTMPYFLATRNMTPQDMRYKTCASLQKYPSDRKSKQQLYLHEPVESQIGSESLRYRQGSEYSHNGRERKNTLTLIKEELNNILDTPVSREPIVSESYELFKQSQDLYRPSPTREQADEMEQIKQKVQKKKATFANLKLEAMKILDDDL